MAPPAFPPRRPTVERDDSVFGFDIEAVLTHVMTTVLVVGFAVYAWKTGMTPDALATRVGGAALAYFASRNLTVLFGDWKAWRLRDAATLWLPFEWQCAVSLVSFVLARQLPQMAREGLHLEKRLFGLPSQIVIAAALYAAFYYAMPHLPPQMRAALMLEQTGRGVFMQIGPTRP